MTDEERRKRLEEMSSDATKHLVARKERLEQKALQDKKEMEKDEKEREDDESTTAAAGGRVVRGADAHHAPVHRHG